MLIHQIFELDTNAVDNPGMSGEVYESTRNLSEITKFQSGLEKKGYEFFSSLKIYKSLPQMILISFEQSGSYPFGGQVQIEKDFSLENKINFPYKPTQFLLKPKH